MRRRSPRSVEIRAPDKQARGTMQDKRKVGQSSTTALAIASSAKGEGWAAGRGKMCLGLAATVGRGRRFRVLRQRSGSGESWDRVVVAVSTGVGE